MVYTHPMQLSKYLHSCVLVEDQGKTVLFDPGIYTYEAHALDMTSLSQLDCIAITHEHADHVYIPFLKEILVKFPNTPIVTNSSVKALLEKEQISASIAASEYLTLTPVPHERVWMGPVCENSMITAFHMFSHPGDSLSFATTARVLALPISGPWANTTWAVEKALEVKPEVILPIHDFHWKDDFRKSMYERLEEFFGQKGIRFLKAETGEKFTI